MSMPRYKYAIGNAPVRFPSAKTQKSGGQPNMSTSADEHIAPTHARSRPAAREQDRQLQPGGAAERTKRWSLLSLVQSEASSDMRTADPSSVKKSRSQQDLRSAHAQGGRLTASSGIKNGGEVARSSSGMQRISEADRTRSTSMSATDGKATAAVPAHTRVQQAHASTTNRPRSSLSIPRIENDGRRAKRVSWVVPFDSGSRSSSRASSVRSGVDGQSASEQSSLLSHSDADEMSQPRQRSFLNAMPQAFRPSSLFWTDAGSKDTETVQGDRRASKSSVRSYGSTSTITGQQPVATPNEDDPYGYRAMAGPTLLPVFHEQQQKSRRASRSSASSFLSARSCAPDLHSSTWRWLSFVGLLAISSALTYLFIF